MIKGSNKALILVDIQNDFIKDGALEVKNGEEVIKVANDIMPEFENIIATQDWHPKNHKSFAANNNKNIGDIIDLNGLSQFMWPNHCVQNTFGSELAKDLNKSSIQKIIYKGTDPEIDSYSGFFDNGHLKSTELNKYLKDNNITDLYIMGLATDYCVKFTAIDAFNLGYNTFLIEDGCRAVNINKDDSEKALKEMKELGIQIIQSKNIFAL